MADPTTTQDRMPPRILDFSKARPRSAAPLPQLRAHESVLVQTDSVLPIADMASRAKAENDGGQVLADLIADLKRRRITTASLRRNGQNVIDHEAEALSFGAIRGGESMRALRRATDFDVTVQVPQPDGSKRSVTTSAFALIAGALAHTAVAVAAESVPTICDQLVQDLDDIQPHTEIPELLDFTFTDPADMPKPLGETEEYREVGAGEDRYTILQYKDGYQRAFSQDMIDRVPGRVFSELTDLGRGAMEVMELFALRKIIDFHGSKTTGTHHAMVRNRSAAALFSATANTPSTRTPSGTRIQNNALVDISDVEAVRSLLAGMRNSRGYPFANPLKVILVPDALWLTAWTILNSQHTPGVYNEVNFFGPTGPGNPGKLLSSPYLDLLTTSAWYGGDPQREFVRKWKQRPEVAVHGGTGTEPYVRTREGMRIRIGWDMTVGARAHFHWVESLSGTTAPGDA